MGPAAGSIIANRFELLSELGRGGMGTVWLAHHRALDARCAVKFMTLDAMKDASVVARFELEARTVAKLSSANIVRVIDYDVHEGVPFIAMEYLDGEDLALRLEREKRLPPAEAHRLVSEVAKGLARAHAAGVVHRDLKPGNVFIAREITQEGTREQECEVVKLLDFGIVKFTGADACDGLVNTTQFGTLLGTPAYMSPEQARGDAGVDHRSDLWSLAVIAFECLTGKSPFEADTMGSLFAKILADPLPVPSMVEPSLPPAFDRWWARAAARDPGRRFESALELADALGHALGVCAAAGPSARGRARHRAAIALAALVVAPLAIAMTALGTDARPPHGPVTTTIDVAAPAAASASAPQATPTGAPETVTLQPALEARVSASKRPRAPVVAAPPLAQPIPGAIAPKARAPAEPPDDVDFGI